MSIDDFERADRLLRQALELVPSRRAGFLASSCEGDERLHARLSALLEASDVEDGFSTGGVRDRPTFEALTTGLETETPERLGIYRIVREIGRGGMATVFLAERDDGEFEQQVALKLLDAAAGGPDGARRFAQEREILARLRHRSIAQIYDGGVAEDGRPWFAMELVEGRPIDEHCNAQRLPIEQRLELVLDVLEALQAAHGQLVVHRDLKPSNLLVTADGHVKLLDFGIAKILDGAPESGTGKLGKGPTEATGALRVLTPRYASPEQLAGEPVTTATDTFQVGVLLYLLIAGRIPFELEEPSIAELRRTLDTQLPKAPSTANTAHESSILRGRPRLKRDLDAIVLKALRREPDQRYGSASELADELRHALSGLPVVARRGSMSYLASRWLARHRLLAVSAVLLVGYALTATWSTLRVAGERDRAHASAERSNAVTSFLEQLFRDANPRVSGRADLTARELLESAPARIESELAGQEEVQSILFRLTGTLLQDLGDEVAAQPLLERSLALSEDLDDPGAGAIRQASLRALALLRTDQVKEEEAFALLDRALSELDSVPPRERPLERAHDLVARGQVLYALGRFPEALETYSRAVAAYEQGDNVDPRVLARARSRHAEAHRRASRDTDRSIELLEETVAEYRKVYGQSHPELPRVLKNLAAALGSRAFNARRDDPSAGSEDLARVLELLEEALEIARRTFGETHPSVARVHQLLGASAFAEKDWPAVAREYGRSQAIYQSLPGFQEDAASAGMYVGIAAREQGDLEASSTILLSALRSLEEHAGTEHHLLAPVLFQLGESSGSAGAWDRAIAYYRRAYEILLASRGPDSRLARSTRSASFDAHLGKSRQLLEQGDAGAARKAWHEAATIAEADSEIDPARHAALRDLEEALELVEHREELAL